MVTSKVNWKLYKNSNLQKPFFYLYKHHIYFFNMKSVILFLIVLDS